MYPEIHRHSWRAGPTAPGRRRAPGAAAELPPLAAREAAVMVRPLAATALAVAALAAARLRSLVEPFARYPRSCRTPPMRSAAAWRRRRHPYYVFSLLTCALPSRMTRCAPPRRQSIRRRWPGNVTVLRVVPPGRFRISGLRRPAQTAPSARDGPSGPRPRDARAERRAGRRPASCRSGARDRSRA